MSASATSHPRGTPPHGPTSVHDAVVVGGGIAGLVAAYDLAEAGLNVCLLEATEAWGGRVQSAALAGLTTELGAEAFATRGGAVTALLHDLGLAAAVTRPAAAPAWVVTAQGAHPLPASGAVGIPARPLAARRAIGLPAALWAATEPWRPRTRHSPQASLAEVVRSRIGTRATAALVAPVVEGVYSTAPDNLAFEAQRELAQAYARTGSLVRAAREVRSANLAAGGAVASVTGGLSRLVARLVTELRDRGVTLRTGASVERLTAAPGAAPDQPDVAQGNARWRVHWSGGVCLTRTVVLAVPPAETESLLTGEPVRPGTALETEVETVALVIDSPALDGKEGSAGPRGTGALIRPGHPRIAAKALTHATAKWVWLRETAPAGRHVLRLSYGSRGTPPATATLTDTAAATLALHDAAEVLGVPLDPAQLVAHARARFRIPARAQPPALPEGVRCTGEAYAGTGLASVVPHARQTAAAVTRLLRSDAP